jgi:hypothetical protein
LYAAASHFDIGHLSDAKEREAVGAAGCGGPLRQCRFLKSGLEGAIEKEYINRLSKTFASYGIHPHSRRKNA